MSSNPIILMDGNNVFMRLYSLNPSYESFMQSLQDLESEGSTLWFWDGFDSRSYRRDIYPEYKANRSRKPFDSAVFDLMNDYKANQTLPRIEIPQWEADDVIAYLAKKLRLANPTRDIILYTTDADLKTLNLSARVRTPWIKSLSEVSATDIHLYKSLVGDTSDNIKGCKGFGKTSWNALTEDHKHLLSEALQKGFDYPELTDCKYSRLLQSEWENVKTAYKLVDFRYDETLPKLIERYYVSGSKV